MKDQVVVLPFRKTLTGWRKQMDRCLVKFSKGNCKPLHLGSTIRGWGLSSWKAGLQMSPWGVLEDNKLDRSWQCALMAKKASSSLDYHRQSIASRSRKVILPLCSALVRSYLACWVQFCAPCAGETWSYWRASSKGP